MKRKILLFVLLALALCLLFSVISCGDDESGASNSSNEENSNSDGKSNKVTLTISCKTTAKPGDRIGFGYDMSDGSPIYSKYLTTEIVGENTVGGEFESVEIDNVTYTYLNVATTGKVKVQATYAPGGGKGTFKSNVVEITVAMNEIKTAEDLMSLDGSSDDWELKCDLDLSEIDNWTPIDFSGTLDGCGHKITGLKVSGSSTSFLALFGLLNGDVKNLTVEDAIIKGTGTSYCAGILAGTLNGGTISNVIVSGVVDAPYYRSVGGVVGFCSNGTLDHCMSSADVKGSESVGGIVGIAETKAQAPITGCKNYGSVSGKDYVGGVCGSINAEKIADDYYELFDNENHGIISGTSGIGGVFGVVATNCGFQIKGAINTGAVTGSSTGNFVGGIVGKGEKIHSITDSDNSADITGGCYVGGYVGDSENTKINAGKKKNTNTITGKGMVGGFAGRCGYIVDAINNGEVISTGYLVSDGEMYSYVGGIAGFCTGAYGCENNTDIIVSGSGLYVGGICGYAEVDGIDSFSSNTNRGSVSGYQYVGGIAGAFSNTNGNSSGDIRVAFCQNIGAISGYSYVGGIFGLVSGTPELKSDGVAIFNSENQGEIVGNQNGEGVGGIVGYAGKGLCLIENCKNKADVTGGIFTGGILGTGQGTKIKGEDTENNSSIKGTVGVGGIAGYAGIVEYATNRGTVAATGYNEKNNCFAGGILGYGEGVIGCTNNADVTAEGGGGAVGGIAGFIVVSQKGVVYENVNNGKVEGGSYVGGVIGYLSCATGNATYKAFSNQNMGDVKGILNVGGVCGYVQGLDGCYFEITNCVNGGEVLGDGVVGGICGGYEYLRTDAGLMYTNSTLYGEMLGQ